MPTQQKINPAQHQNQQPGIESQMTPRSRSFAAEYHGTEKLRGKVALITGGDSGIGRAVALAFASEGADVAIAYLNENEDAKETKQAIEKLGRRCISLSGDIGDESVCQNLVEQTVKTFGHLDILVNNAAEQHPQESIEDITAEQLERTFGTNIFSMFYLTKAALKHLKSGSAIINTTSVTADKGNQQLLDYSSTKGAIIAFTRSLSQSLAEKGIRVNGVAPCPIWTPLITSTFSAKKVAKFGKDTPLGPAGQPDEVAHSYVFLASKDSFHMTGQILHPNDGSVING